MTGAKVLQIYFKIKRLRWDNYKWAGYRKFELHVGSWPDWHIYRFSFNEGRRWKRCFPAAISRVTAAYFRCCSAPIHLTQMNGSLTDLSRPWWHSDDDPFIWIMCAGPGKHLKHAGTRTGTGEHWSRHTLKALESQQRYFFLGKHLEI